MNDIGYINIEFKNSQSYNTVKNAREYELINRLPYVKYAIEYHTKENNPMQVKYFNDELKLIKKRLKIKD